MRTRQTGGRYVDDGHPLSVYAGLIQVECPDCGGRAVSALRPDVSEPRYSTELLFRPRRLTCGACALTREWAAPRRGNASIGASLSGPDDPFFALPLWLQTPCRGEVLWAYNERHLDTLEAYVAASIRRHAGPMGMLQRLPAWIKAAAHREDVLRAIGRLRERVVS